MRHFVLCVHVLLMFTAVACRDDVLQEIRGTVDVEVMNVRSQTAVVALSLQPGSARVETVELPPVQPLTRFRFENVPVGLATVGVQTRTAVRTVLDDVRVFPVAVVSGTVTRVVVDFATGVIAVTPPADGTPGVCLDDGGEPEITREVLCGRCTEPDGAIMPKEDDEACGMISCDGLDHFRLEGDNTPSGTSTCDFEDFDPMTSGRCASVAVCRASDDPAACGPPRITRVLEAGLCQTIVGCDGSGPPSRMTAPDGTACGTSAICRSGACVAADIPPPPPPATVGCSDGEREGFLDALAFPSIAACAGAFSVAGVTIPDLVPQCGRAAGDDSDQSEGMGCSAVDLCAEGWHVCLGKAEVLSEAPGGCAAAVPPQTPDKALFFAVAQRSTSASVCDDDDSGALGGDNDVFGCGNLGTLLTPEKNCGPLTRVLASTAPNRCGFNEAEPPLGPWQCQGGSESHLHEGALVTKAGCSGASCSYDGNPIGNSDKGGVLCCAD